MTTTWYALDTNTGVASAAASPPDSRLKFNEAHVEAILALNPHLLGVEGHLPLLLCGGSTATIPDQLYVEETGRVVVVEIKRDVATVAALAQLLGYAEHLRTLPTGEIDACVAEMAGGASQVELALGALDDLVDVRSTRRNNGAVLARVQGALALLPAGAASLAAATHGLWSRQELPLLGWPSRMILVAKGFDEDCVAMARALTARMVDVSLISTDFARDDDGLLFEWSPEVHSDRVDATWRVVRRILERRLVSEAFTFNGWAEHSSLAGVSFSARANPHAKFHISCSDDGEVTMSTWLPHRWLKEGATGKRRALTDALEASLPGFMRVKGELQRVFTIGRQKPVSEDAAAADAAELLALAVLKVVVPSGDTREA